MSAGVAILPPSPPTTSSKNTPRTKETLKTANVASSLNCTSADNKLPLGTPDDSPVSLLESESGSGTKRKRVVFSSLANVHDPPNFTTSPLRKASVRDIPPSKECSSSASILKVSSQTEGQTGVHPRSPKTQSDLYGMLESVSKQLARNERADSIDAYQTLTSTLKAYNDVPEGNAFNSRIVQLLEYLRRDLGVGERVDNEAADTNLVIHASKVLIILAWKQDFSNLLSNDTQAYMLDRAILVLEHHQAPKAVIVHYLHLLAVQNFRQGVVGANGRVTRLLDVLQALPLHVKGNGILSERLLVYQRLVEQAGSTMKSKPSGWVRDLAEGLANPHKDIRNNATELGRKSATALPGSATIARTFRDVLSRKNTDGSTLNAQICKRIEKHVESHQDGQAVPQIFAVVITLLKGLENRVENWSGFKDWLQVVQRCFNCSNSIVKTEAYSAWNRLIYSVRLMDAPDQILSMLLKPITAQLTKHSKGQDEMCIRSPAFSAYCNLLYYSFRPGGSHKHYSRMWDEVVVKVLRSDLVASNTVMADRACRIVTALLSNGGVKPKFWRESRVLETGLIEPEELPTLDCKWVRVHCAPILQLFKLLLRHSSWGNEGLPEQAYIGTAWKCLSKALGYASQTEVRPSHETAKAVTNVLLCLRELWKDGPVALNLPADDPKVAFLTRFQYLLMSVVMEVSPIPLVDGASLQVHLTERMSMSVSLSPALVLFLQTVSVRRNETMPQESHDHFVRSTVELVGTAKTALRSRLQLYLQCLGVTVEMHKQRPVASAINCVWRAVVSLVDKALETEHLRLKVATEGDIEGTVADVVTLLSTNLVELKGTVEPWRSLLQKAISITKEHKECPLDSFASVGEPILCSLGDRSAKVLTWEVSELVLQLLPFTYPPVRPIVTIDMQRSPHVPSTSSTGHPFERLLQRLICQLQCAYFTLIQADIPVIYRTLAIACICLKDCPELALLSFLTMSKRALVLWLEDSQRLCTSANPVGTAKLVAGRKLCSMTIDCMKKLFKQDTEIMPLTDLLSAGFSSNHKKTINETIEMWNATYGTAKKLDYSKKLRNALDRLRPYADLHLPAFGTPDAEAVSHILVEVVDIQKDPKEQKDEVPAPVKSSTEDCVKSNPAQLASPPITRLDAPRSRQTTPSNRSPDKVASRKKLRHDDSQVDYIAIESSPLPTAEPESQYLTDRQKEIRARRQAEPAVVFADLRSSPAIRIQDKPIGKMQQLFLDGSAGGADKSNEPATPVLPVQMDVNVDVAMPTSPTPRSKQQALRLDDIEMPSSPPAVPEAGGLEPAKATDEATEVTEEVTEMMIEEMVDEAMEGATDSVTEDVTIATGPGVVLPSIEDNDDKVDSDDLDMLSASQLTQNLDWAVETEAKVPQTQVDDHTGTPVEEPSRKRKQSVTTPTGKKRARRTSSTSVRPSSLVASLPGQRDISDIYDCITEDTMARSRRVPTRLSQSSQSSSKSWPSTRRPGRPPKVVLDEHSIAKEPQVLEVGAGAGQMDDARHSGQVEPDGIAVAAEHEVEQPEFGYNKDEDTPGIRPHKGIELPESSLEAALRDNKNAHAEQRQNRENTNVLPQEPMAEHERADSEQNPDVKASLQAVLELVKSAVIQKPELREIEDLLFEIRTEAQQAMLKSFAQ